MQVTAGPLQSSCLASLGTAGNISLPLILLVCAVFMALCDSEAAGYHTRWLSERTEEYDQRTRKRLVTAGLIPSPAGDGLPHPQSARRHEASEHCQC